MNGDAVSVGSVRVEFGPWLLGWALGQVGPLAAEFRASCNIVATELQHSCSIVATPLSPPSTTEWLELRKVLTTLAAHSTEMQLPNGQRIEVIDAQALAPSLSRA